MARASDSTLKVKIERDERPEKPQDPPAEGAPTRVVTVTIDDRARRSSPPPSVAVVPMVDVAASGSKRWLMPRAATRRYGVTGPPEEHPLEAMPQAPDPRRAAARPSRIPSMLVALIALLALGVLLATTVALMR